MKMSEVKKTVKKSAAKSAAKSTKSAPKKAAGKTAVKSRVMKAASPGRGRPAIEIPVPLSGKKFTVQSVYDMVQKRRDERGRATKVTVAKFINNLKNRGLVKVIDKKMSSSNRGQPIRIWVATNKAVKRSLTPAKSAPAPEVSTAVLAG